MATHRILIVDDQRDVRRMLHAGIETLGADYKVVDVPSGEEAMLVLYRHPIDLLIVDVRLPGISGLELQKRALAYNPALKLILVTGVSEPAMRRQVEAAHADAFFYKPVEMAPFLEAVQRCFGKQAVASQAEVAAASPSPAPFTPRSTPPAVAAPAAPVEPEMSISDYISWLRQDLKAGGVFLLDDTGKIMEQAGDFADLTAESTLMSELLTAASAAGRVAYSLGARLPSIQLWFGGVHTDLYLAGVTPAVMLLVACPADSSGLQAGKVIEALRGAVRELCDLLVRFQTPSAAEALPEAVLPSATAPEPEVVELIPELDLLFSQARPDQLQAVDLDAFWDGALEGQETESMVNAESLTYEQASRLGLTPQ